MDKILRYIEKRNHETLKFSDIKTHQKRFRKFLLKILKRAILDNAKQGRTTLDPEEYGIYPSSPVYRKAQLLLLQHCFLAMNTTVEYVTSHPYMKLEVSPMKG